MGHASRSSGLLHLKVSRGRVFQSCLNIGGDTTADDKSKKDGSM
jgi:hypothetical protein